MPDDSFTVALLHMNGTDASTTFTDESGKTWSANGDAQLDTAQFKFGTASLLVDGTGDFISSADSADWQLDGGSNSNKWTVDFWVRFNGDPGTGAAGFFSQYTDTSNFYGVRLNNNTLEIWVRSGGSSTVLLNNAWNPATATWYHVAVVKNGTTGYLMFIDGTQIGTTQTDTDTIPDLSSNMRVGVFTNSSGTAQYLNGWIDELRFSKGVARWTANFTPPTFAYPFLTSEYSSYTYTGQTANTLIGRLVAAAQGAYTYTGQVATFLWNRVLAAVQGAYTYTGQSALFTVLRKFKPLFVQSENVGKQAKGTDTGIYSVDELDLSKYIVRR